MLSRGQKQTASNMQQPLGAQQETRETRQSRGFLGLTRRRGSPGQNENSTAHDGLSLPSSRARSSSTSGTPIQPIVRGVDPDQPVQQPRRGDGDARGQRGPRSGSGRGSGRRRGSARGGRE